MAKPEITEDQVYIALNRFSDRAGLDQICNELGFKRNRRGTWGSKGYAKYLLIGRILQRMKRAGQVEYIGGPGAGWRLTIKGKDSNGKAS